ncbi:MAG TPA: class I SAM-dependent methyltransferase [Longimicrobiales bacterium]
MRLFRARDYITGEEFEVERCRECGAGVTVPQPAAEALGAYYPAGYYKASERARFPAAVEALQRRLYGARARAVEALAGRPGRVLDIGCGPGFLLDAFRRRGWEPQGVELGDAAAAHAREVLRIPVHVGPRESWPWPEGHFDAVVMWHVLEHWPDPREPLTAVARLLRPGGAFMVGVPNFDSLEARVARDRWFHLDVPRHLAHLTPRWLRAELPGRGFEVRRLSYVVPEFDVFSFVQSALNRLGLRQNLLYDLLRGRRAKVLQGGGGAGWAQSAASVALAVPLGFLGVPVTLALAAARQGSSVAVYAVKNG